MEEIYLNDADYSITKQQVPLSIVLLFCKKNELLVINQPNYYT